MMNYWFMKLIILLDSYVKQSMPSFLLSIRQPLKKKVNVHYRFHFFVIFFVAFTMQGSNEII